MAVTTEQITQQLPPHLVGGFEEGVKRALELSNQPHVPYTRRRLALPSEEAVIANRMAHRNMSGYAPYLRNAREQLNIGSLSFPAYSGLFGNKYRDPYQRGMLDNIAAQGNRIFKEKVLPELDARFIQLGQYGSKKHAMMTKNAARDIQKEIMNQQEDVLSRGYTQGLQAFGLDRSRLLNRAGLLSRLGMTKQMAKVAEIEAYNRAADFARAQQQAHLDQEFENWKEERRHPHEKLEQLFRFLYGIPVTPSTLRRTDVQMPSSIMHRSDWSNFARGAGAHLLGNLLTGRGEL